MHRIGIMLVAFALLMAVASAAPCEATTQTDRQPIELITHISSDDMALLLEDEPPAQLQQYSSEPTMRRDVLRNIRELLAEAIYARELGLASSSEVQDQLDFMRTLAIAQAYDGQHRKRGNLPAFSYLTQKDVDAYLGQAGMNERFDHFLVIAQSGKILPSGDIPELQKAAIKQDWAKIHLTEQLAVKEGFDGQRKTQLRVGLQCATLLAGIFTRDKLTPQVVATDLEVMKYLSLHPEYSVAPKRAKAEALLKRARRGESFSRLARENTDDPGSKENGGFYDWFGRGRMVKEFEDASFRLRVGQISGIVETQYGFHIIKLLGKRSFKDPETGKFEDQVRVRHILVSTMAPPDPDNPMAPQMSFKDKARADVEREKRDKLIAALVARAGVMVPDDFSVTVPGPIGPALAVPPPAKEAGPRP
jgi:hypothetical protein